MLFNPYCSFRALWNDRKGRSCSNRLSQRHAWLTDHPVLTSCFFGLETHWSFNLSSLPVKDMTLVQLSWDLFAHFLSHINFLDSLKDSSDVKLRKCPFLLPQSNYHPSFTIQTPSHHIKESESGFLIKAAIVPRKAHPSTHLSAPCKIHCHPLLSRFSFSTLHVSYPKHSSLTKINCDHNVFIF